MEADVLNALKTQAAYLPGGRDHDDRLLILVPVSQELQPWTKRYLELCTKYLLSILSCSSSDNDENIEFVVIIDTQKCSWRLARSTIRQITTLIGTKLQNLIIVRPDAFWDKQRVEHCAKTQKKGEPIIISKSRLLKYFAVNELPEELGGTLLYNHEQWLQNRIRIEEFKQSYEKVINDLENLHVILLDSKSIRANETDQTLRSCTTINLNVQKSIKNIIEIGNNVILEIDPEILVRKQCVTQDLPMATEQIRKMLNDLDGKQNGLEMAWIELEKSLEDSRELSHLEDGVSFVTNWILSTGEQLLNGQQKIGCDIQTCEELRRTHENLEMQCLETYGIYAELLHKIEKFPLSKDSFAHKDLMSQKDFMDFVCRSFATRLERRRNVLITSIRFYRMVSEYFDKTNDVFETLVMGHNIDDMELASINLQKLKDNQQNLDNVVKELEKEGEKLSDILSMPVKDALGRDIGIDYSDDIASIRDILDATIARRNIFIDSVELQKLTLDQLTHIHLYEKDAAIAIKWINDLYNVMIRTHSHVGCNVYEIQMQKEELQTFQETAKGTFNYGCQLLDAALTLRQSCKLNDVPNRQMYQNFNQIWKHLQIVSQEQMTRLRVSAVFHRSVDEHCIKLQELKSMVNNLSDIDELEKRRIRLRKYLVNRERLLVEVGRMVRLGRLLKTRLKEPFVLDEKSIGMSDSSSGTTTTTTTTAAIAVTTVTPTSGNLISCDAIAVKLGDVARIAESLDYVLRDIQNGLDFIDDSNSSGSSLEKKIDKSSSSQIGGIIDSRGSNEEWNSSVKSSTEDESFVTASETFTPQSLTSSSYRTASEGITSPWWHSTNGDKNSLDAESSDMDPEVPSMALLSGVISSASVSFDESEHSFLSTQHSPMYSSSDENTIGIDDSLALDGTGNNTSNSKITDSQSTICIGVATPNVSSSSELLSIISDDQQHSVNGTTSGISSISQQQQRTRSSSSNDDATLETTTSSISNNTNNEPIKKVRINDSDDNLVQDITSWTTYYNSLITKHSIKGCL